jgi:hypothetical protein
MNRLVDKAKNWQNLGTYPVALAPLGFRTIQLGGFGA